jgi:hypothetical protein
MSHLVRQLLAAVALCAAAAALLSAVPAARAAATGGSGPAATRGPGPAATRSPGPVATSSPGPVLWTVPAGVDTAPIDSVACPSLGFCVAVDRAGNVLWSANPTGGARAWLAADVDGANELTSVSCPATTLCVAVDAAGNAVTSQNPAGGAGAWAVAKIDSSATANNTDNAGSVLLRGVSCPSTSLCVAVDAAGNVLASGNPAGGSSVWTITHADANRSHGCSGGGLACQPPFVAVSCPSTALCAAVDFSGNLLTSDTPTSPGPWASVSAQGGALGSLWGISCPTLGFCAAVDGAGGQAITFNPATPGLRRAHPLPASAYGIWCQSASLCQASAQPKGGLSSVLGSYNPGAPKPTWTSSPLGAVNAIACPSPSVCIAGDDQGNIVAGATTRGLTSLLRDTVLSTRRLPSIATLLRTPHERYILTTPIAGKVTLTWTVPGARLSAPPVTLATTSHTFRGPGTATLTLRLNRTAVRRFRAATKRLAVTGTATFTASTGMLRTTRMLAFTRSGKPKRGKRR